MTLGQWQRHFPEGRVPFDQALSVVRHLVDVFHKAHVEQCEHGEISSASVLVEQKEDGTLAVRLDGAAAAGPDGIPGVRRYRAPECWWGASQSTYTDQYALAVLFVELVTGKVPFAEIFATDDDTVIRTAVCNQPPKLPEDCPRRDVLLRALSKDPRLRFRSCGEFFASLSQVYVRPSHDAEPRTHEHVPHHRRPSVRRHGGHRSFRSVALVLLALGGLAVWAVKSGWYDRMVRSLEDKDAHADAAPAATNLPPVRTASDEVRQRNRLTRIEEEIRRQKGVADQALRDLQDFLEKGGGMLAEMRRDALRQDLQRLQSEKTGLQNEMTAAERYEEALGQLRTRAVPYEMVASAIPAESEVALAYKALGEAAKRMDELSAGFTERHPEVARQKQALEAASRQYATAVASAYRHVQGERTAKARRFAESGTRIERLVTEIAQLEREIQVSRLRQAELEQARERESRRLAELRQMETRIRFGGESVLTGTNAVPRAPVTR